MPLIRLHCSARTTSAMLFQTATTPQTLTSSTLFHFNPKFRLHTAATATATSVTTKSAIDNPAVQTLATSPPRHPWPEWVSFVDRLKSGGYLPQSSAPFGDDELIYRELRVLKDPCLSFARDRHDVFKSLSQDDIRNVVEVGCPKLVRKVVNSAKRLRVYVGLEEKNVCEACSLRESCDRAYLKPNDSEGVRTVDIMRLLLFYALDPMVISEAVRPTNIERAESSVRILPSMIMDLSEASKSPVSEEPVVIKEKVNNSTATVLSEATGVRKGEWFCPKCNFINYSRNTQCHKCNVDGPKKQASAPVVMKKGDWNCPQCNVDGPKKQASAPVVMKKGDWNCPQCNFLNYAKNIKCRQCDEDAPKKRERKHVQPKTSDWHCHQCNFFNYSRNIKCRKCNVDAPEKRETKRVEPKKGDWDCPQCQFVNFASRSSCFQCTGIRPPQSMNTGEWVCPKCNYLNFRRNVTCLKCDGEQAKDLAALHKQHGWRKPTPTTIS